MSRLLTSAQLETLLCCSSSSLLSSQVLPILLSSILPLSFCLFSFGSRLETEWLCLRVTFNQVEVSVLARYK